METPTSSESSPPRRPGMAVILLAAVLSSVVTLAVATRLRDPAPPAAAPAPAAKYQCPMHPAVVRDHPADCPICGMDLVLVEAPAPAAPPPAAKYQCPMHPAVVRDHPADCPICGMDLVLVETPAAAPAPSAPRGLAAVDIDPRRQQLIGLKVAKVTRGPIGGSWRTTGKVAIDETRVRHFNLKVPGFVERVYADFVGKRVSAGDPLFSLYSPELLAAQEELLLALRYRDAMAEAEGGGGTSGAALLLAARRKLELWDVPAAEIAAIESSRKVSKSLMFRSPVAGVVTKKDVVEGMKLDAGAMPYEIVDLSTVWVLVDVYEAQLRFVGEGMAATLELKAFPERRFQGEVVFVDPLLDPATRTVKLRLTFPNPTGELRPEMFGEVVLRGTPREALRVPADAILDSGTLHVVFVAAGEGRFLPRRVEVGETDQGLVEVTAGLEEGEEVVTRANFLVDSESRLRASLAELGAGGSREESARVLDPPPPPARASAPAAGPATAPPTRPASAPASGPASAPASRSP